MGNRIVRDEDGLLWSVGKFVDVLLNAPPPRYSWEDGAVVLVAPFAQLRLSIGQAADRLEHIEKRRAECLDGQQPWFDDVTTSLLSAIQMGERDSG